MVPSQCKAHLIDESIRTDKLWVNVERLAAKIDLRKKNILEKRIYLENLQICEKEVWMMAVVGKYRCFYRLPDEPKPPLPSSHIFNHYLSAQF